MMERSGRESPTGGDNRPDLRALLRIFQDPVGIRSVALTGILILLIFYSLHFARDFFFPVILALLLNLLLAPLIRLLHRIHIPQAVGAGVVILVLLGLAAYAVYRVSAPAAEWIEKMPRSLGRVQGTLRGLLKPVEEVQETTKQIERMATLGKVSGRPPVEITQYGLSEIVFVETQRYMYWSVVTVILLYFLLASGNLFLLKLVRVLPTLEDKKRAVEICRKIEDDISTYLSTITLVNLGLGTAVGLAMFILGMPNPVLWGIMAAVLNYIPYLGAFVGITTVMLAALLSFESLTIILLAPFLYLVLNVLEAYLVTPMILGRRLALNPVVIFLWLIFWGWIWGIFGLVIAVPLLAIFKIICDHLSALAAVSEFLSTDPRPAT